MEEMVIGTFDDVLFIEGVTQLIQTNWQNYFSPVIPNGVYEGLEPRNYLGSSVYSNGRIFVTDGAVFANGICARIRTQDGYTDIGTCPSGAKDRLICVRVYFDSNTAKLIQKTNVMEIPEEQVIFLDTYTLYSLYTMDRLVHDEPYMMERNSSYWDIPIFYQGASDLEYTSKGLDLRRVINKTRQIDPEDTVFKGTYSKNKKISGNNIYHIDVTQSDEIYLCFDPIDLPDGAIIFVQGVSSYEYKIHVNSLAATNNVLACNDMFHYNATAPLVVVNDGFINIDQGKKYLIKITYAGTRGMYAEPNYGYIRCYSLDFHIGNLPNDWS